MSTHPRERPSANSILKSFQRMRASQAPRKRRRSFPPPGQIDAHTSGRSHSKYPNMRPRGSESDVDTVLQRKLLPPASPVTTEPLQNRSSASSKTQQEQSDVVSERAPSPYRMLLPPNEQEAPSSQQPTAEVKKSEKIQKSSECLRKDDVKRWNFGHLRNIADEASVWLSIRLFALLYSNYPHTPSIFSILFFCMLGEIQNRYARC